MYYLESFDLDMENKQLLPSKLNQFKDKLFVVMVMAEWCGHCQTAKPNFIKAANELKDSNVIFCFADITGKTEYEKDLDKKTKMLSKFRGFPHFVAFKNGKETDIYEGDRSKESLMKFASS